MGVKPNTQTLRPLARWPNQQAIPKALLATAQLAAKKGQNILIAGGEKTELNPHRNYCASPIFVDKQLMGVVAFETTQQSAQQKQPLFDLLEQSKQWLALASAKQEEPLPKEFYPAIVKILAHCLDADTYHACLMTLISALTQQFQCGRVSVGEVRQQRVDIVALSNSAKFDNRAQLMRSIAGAMEEAIDQDHIIVHPPIVTPQHYSSRAHLELVRQHHSGAICTFPMVDQKHLFAVITLERDASNPFTAEQIRSLEQTLALLAPYLHLKKTLERSVTAHALAKLKQKLAWLFSLKQLGLKSAVVLLLTILSIAGVVQGDFRVPAEAVLEGKVQRVVAAPIDGVIMTAAARAGDTVMQGATLAVMDDRDLQLERTKLASEQQQALREYREARANSDLVKVNILNAKLQQLEAQLQLAQDQLQRTTIVAPFESVVIEGDLSDLLGTPVEQGQKLFKIAPLDGYRIILKVREQLIAYVKTGQSGFLSLTSLPEQRIPLTVQKITTVAKVEDGDNVFRVEASLQRPSTLLRPGMVGVAKINAGQKTLLWIWTHELIDWLTLWLWSWWP